MSYQIKSTPFFQRIVATSKQSGDLQKLKEEYDRIKIFNEKTLEVKVRQARLKRLFQEIEEIKETSIKKRRVTPTTTSTSTGASAQATKLSSSQDQRSKAKDLGQYYSKLNASRRGVDGISDLQYYRTKASQTFTPNQKLNRVAALKQTKERINKRAAYGNCISNWNMHRMLMGKLRNEVSEGCKVIGKPSSSNSSANASANVSANASASSSLSSVAGKEKLKYRISYGNTISDLNMLIMPKRKNRCNVSQESLQPPPRKAESGIVAPATSALSDVTIRPVSTSSVIQGQQQDYLVLDNGAVQPLYPCDPLALEKSLKARKHWHKVPLLLSILNCIPRPLLAKKTDDSDEDKQFQLRSISNDTNLLLSTIAPEICNELDLSENEEQYIQNEMLYSAQNLSDTQSNATSYFSATTNEQLPAIAQQHLHLKPIPRDKASVDPLGLADVMRVYEPISRQMVEKEVFNTGVQKLVDAFEHSNNSV